jgi:exodeoxyribonuclease-3
VKLISWNVNGIRAAWKKGLPEFVAAENPDVLCLQETKIQREQLTPELTDLAGYRSHWSMAEKKGYSGVGLYSRKRPSATWITCRRWSGR